MFDAIFLFIVFPVVLVFVHAVYRPPVWHYLLAGLLIIGVSFDVSYANMPPDIPRQMQLFGVLWLSVAIGLRLMFPGLFIRPPKVQQK